MPFTVCKASTRHKVRIAGQILLYGSVGTASSAVVYFLQDQIRQVQRLKQLLDSKKCFAEALRKHGISDATIQRMRKSTLEDHIRELESRGLVKLELVDAPPKWTSSPHRGQMYHVQYLHSPRTKKIQTTNSASSEHNSLQRQQLLVSRTLLDVQRCWHLVTKPLITLLKRCTTETQMRKHWVDRIQTSALLGQSRRPYVPSFSRDLHRSRLRHPSFQVALYSQSLAQTQNTQASSTQFTEQVLSAWSTPQDNLLQRMSEFLRTSESILGRDEISNDPMTVLSSVVNLLSNSAVYCPAYWTATDLLKEAIQHRMIDISSLYHKLAHVQAYAHIAALCHALVPAVQWPQSVFLALKVMLQSSGSPSSPFVAISQPIQHLIRDCSMKQLIQVCRDIYAPQRMTSASRTALLCILIDDQKAQFFKFVIALSARASQADNPSSMDDSHHLNEADLSTVTSMLLSVELDGNRASTLRLRLLDFAVQKSCFSVAIQIANSSSNSLPTEQASGTAFLVQQALLLAPEGNFAAIDMRSVIEYYSRCESSLRDAHLPTVATRYLAQASKPSLIRAKYLRQTCTALTATEANSFLHTLDFAEDVILTSVVNELKQESAQRISEQGAALVNAVHEAWTDRSNTKYSSSADDTIDWYGEWSPTIKADHAMEKSTSTTTHSTTQDKSTASVAIAEPTASNSLSQASPTKTSTSRDIWVGKSRETIDDTKSKQIILVKSAFVPNEHWQAEVSIMIERAKHGDVTACLTRLNKLLADGLMPTNTNDALLFHSVMYAFATTLEPQAWLDMAQVCVGKHKLGFGAKAFDRIVYQSISRLQTDTIVPLLRRLIELSASQKFDVGVRSKTIQAAMGAMLDRDVMEDRIPDGAHAYWLLKRVCKVNERLLSRDLIMRVHQVLRDFDKEDAIVMQTFPKAYGQRWSKTQYDHYRSIRLQLRMQNLQAVYDRNAERENLFNSTENLTSYPAKQLKSKKPMILAALHAQNTTEIVSVTPLVEQDERELLTSREADKASLTEAVRACLHQGSWAKAEKLVQKAAAIGVPTAAARRLILRERILGDGKLNAAEIRSLVIDWYVKLDPADAQNAHGPLRAAVTRLTGNHKQGLLAVRMRQDDRRAIDLMIEIHKSDWAQAMPFGMKEYTSLLTAYFNAGDTRGAIWTISLVLKRKLPISVNFMHVLTRESNNLLKSKARAGMPLAAQESHVFWHNVRNICHRRRLDAKDALHKSQVTIMNILLYDARHPDVDHDVYIMGPRLPGQLDTSVTSSNREEAMAQIRQSKFTRATAVKQTQEARHRAWRATHSDHPVWRPNRQQLGLDEQATLAVLESWTETGLQRGKNIYFDDGDGDDDIFSGKDNGYAGTPWTSMDTDMLTTLKKKVHNITRRNKLLPDPQQHETWDLLELVAEIKQESRFREARNVDTALEQVIRNAHQNPTDEARGERIWKDVMRESGQQDWARAGAR